MQSSNIAQPIISAQGEERENVKMRKIKQKNVVERNG